MKRSIDWIFLGLGLIALGILLFVIAGCGPVREQAHTDNQAKVAQAVANAQAGLEAFAKSLGVSYDAAAAKILEGAKEYNLAAAGKTVLPPPEMSADEILSNPDGYHSAAVESREKADGTWFKVLGASVLGLLAPIAVAAARFIPGVGPIAAPLIAKIADFHWFALSTTDQKAADAKVAMVASHAQSVASSVDAAIPGWRDKLPPSAVASIEAILGKAQS